MPGWAWSLIGVLGGLLVLWLVLVAVLWAAGYSRVNVT